MKSIKDYINYIDIDKTPEELEDEFISDFIMFRRENNLTQELLALYSKTSRTKIARIEAKMHSPTIKNILQIIGPLGYTIKIEKVKNKNKLFYKEDNYND